MFRLLCRVIVLALMVVTVPAAPPKVAAAGPLLGLLGLGQGVNLDRLDATLRAVVSGGVQTPQRVIITVKAGKRSALRSLLSGLGRPIVAEHPGIDALSVVVAAADLPVLASYPDVVSIAADHLVRPTAINLGLGGLTSTVAGVANKLLEVVGGIYLPANGDVSGPAVYPQLVRSTLGVQDSVWTGRGIGVAVVDSGLEMSAEFRGRVDAFYDFTGGRADAVAAYDDYGHGTHVASLIGGSGALSSRNANRGLAPNVRFVVFKVLDQNGAGYTSDVIRAIDFAVDNRVRLGIRIINLSLGHPIAQPAAVDPLVQAVERASRAGIVVVAAAGNLGVNEATGRPGYAGITSPGNAPSAITVGAARTHDTVQRSDDRIPDYSSAGPTWYDALVKPDLLAPGHNLVGAAARQGSIYAAYPRLRDGDADYIRLSGTSMATAVATGVVAQMLEAYEAADDGGALTPNAVKAAMQYTAVGIRNDLGLPYDRLRKGAGSLNGKGAIDVARAYQGRTPYGRLWLTGMPSPWTEIGGQSLSWNQGVIWGSSVIWGSTLVWAESQPWASSVIWGSGVIWGSSVIWGSGVIWGSTLVWADSQPWASSVIWGSNSIGYTNGSSVIWGSTTGLSPTTTAWGDIATGRTGSQ